MITTMLGLIAFASAIERYFIRRATWPETICSGSPPPACSGPSTGPMGWA
jgi:hypothetical protein